MPQTNFHFPHSSLFLLSTNKSFDTLDEFQPYLAITEIPAFTSSPGLTSTFEITKTLFAARR